MVSNNPEAAALEVARKHGVEALVQPKLPRSERDDLLVGELRARDVGLIALAGYNQILSACVLEAFPERVVNVHPSLLPAFGGGMAPEPQRQALEYGVKVSGCTVHLVTADVDAGPILAQACVPVLSDDTVDSLSARILVEEHRLYAEDVRAVAEDRVALSGRRVRLLPSGRGDAS